MYVHVLGCMYLNKVCVIFVVIEQRVRLSVAGIADNCDLPNVGAVNEPCQLQPTLLLTYKFSLQLQGFGGTLYKFSAT